MSPIRFSYWRAFEKLPSAYAKIWATAVFVYLCVWPTMSLFRVTAFLTYGVSTPGESFLPSEIFKAFFMGLRFDSVVLFYCLAPLTLLLGLGHVLNLQKLLNKMILFTRAYLTVSILVVYIILAGDLKYYSYFQDHINILAFGLFDDDTLALLHTFWKNYPVLLYLSVFGIILVSIWIGLKKIFRYLPEPLSGKTSFMGYRVLHFILAFVLVFLGGRGSFGLFPLGPADTVISKNSFINYLTSNGVHALYRAIKLRKTQSKSWDANLKYYSYSTPQQAFSDFLNLPEDQLPQDLLSVFEKRSPKNIWAEKTHPHVVVVVMESFGTYWLRYHSEKFDLLGDFYTQMSKGVFLKNFLPSSGSTTGSLSSLMVSAPHRPIGNFLTESEYLQVPFRSSPARIFKSQGYRTRFIYGGNPGWRDMNKFAHFQGFDSIEGDVDVEEKLGPIKERHDWGIYDEDLFKYVELTLRAAQEPQMLLVMTTSNHPPYQVPSSFQPPPQQIPQELSSRLTGDSKLLAAPRFKVYLYSNDQLGKFISRLSSGPLGAQTILAVTGDHSFNLVNFSDSETFYKWSVPLFLMTPPERPLNIPASTFGSHMDIFPTLYNLSLSEVSYFSLGRNLEESPDRNFALHSSGVIANTKNAAIHFSGKSFASFNWQKPPQIDVQNFATTEIEEAPESAEAQLLAKKFRGLMGLLDFYFYSEKNLSKSR